MNQSFTPKFVGIGIAPSHSMDYNTSRSGEVILFLASSAAQVWSAFLIFVVLLLRDLSTEKRERTRRIWSDARSLWRDLLSITNRLDPQVIETLNKAGINSEIVELADTDESAFKSLLHAISNNQTIIMIGRNQLGQPFEHLHLHRQLTAAEWQRTFDTLAREMRDVDRETTEPLKSLKLGLILIGINGLFLVMPAYLSATQTLPMHLMLIATIFVNLFGGFALYSQLRRTLKIID